MIVTALLATYLEWTGALDIALLPYFMAFTAFLAPLTMPQASRFISP